MSRKAYILWIWLLLPAWAGAQQMPLYSLSMLNKYRFNQAYAGLDNSLSITGVYRSQWVDFPGAPKTYQLNAHMPIFRLHGAAGLWVDSDRIGAERTFQAGLSYNYMMTLPSIGYLSFSLSGALLQKSFDGDLIRTPDGSYEGGTIDHKDGVLPSGLSRGSGPVAHVGVYFANNSIEAGLSAENMIAPRINSTDNTFSFQPRRHYTLYGEYLIPFGEEIKLVPSLLLRTDMSQLQSDLNVKVRYRNTLMAGLALRGYNKRSLDAVALFAGYRINRNLLLVYNYDISISPLRNYSRGTHEIMVNYNLGKAFGRPELEPIIYNPRFL